MMYASVLWSKDAFPFVQLTAVAKIHTAILAFSTYVDVNANHFVYDNIRSCFDMAPWRMYEVLWHLLTDLGFDDSLKSVLQMRFWGPYLIFGHDAKKKR